MKARLSALIASSLAIVAMGWLTVSCSPRTDGPAENPSTPSVAPSEKKVLDSTVISKYLGPSRGGGGTEYIPAPPQVQDDSCGAIGHLCD